jgi:diguanylate cyclase (GGDEF)-like protein
MSSFEDELTRTIDKWLPLLPKERRAEFEVELRSLGAEHDRQLDVIATATMRGYANNIRDEITGLVRRKYCLDYLRSLLSAVPTSELPAIGVILLDLDGFKPINDTYGHSAGDRALAAIGGILKAAIRIERGTDVVAHVPVDGVDPTVARAGGDEFLALLQLREADDLLAVTERIRRRVNDRERQRAHGYALDMRLVASIGAVACDLRSVPRTFTVDTVVDRLIRLADNEMYKSKKDGLLHVALAQFTDEAGVEVTDRQTQGSTVQVASRRASDA